MSYPEAVDALNTYTKQNNMRWSNHIVLQPQGGQAVVTITLTNQYEPGLYINRSALHKEWRRAFVQCVETFDIVDRR